MIEYTKGAFGWNLLWRVHGSAVYRAFFPGFIGVACFLFLRQRSNTIASIDERHQHVQHPYAAGVLVSSITFLILFRANHGYRRYWDAAISIHHMMSKWMDTACHATCFHMQSEHYKNIKPPSYQSIHSLNNKFMTRNRERAFQRDQKESYEDRLARRSRTKSINFKQEDFEGIQCDESEELSDTLDMKTRKPYEPAPLSGKARLDGGWRGLFPSSIEGEEANSTFPHKRSDSTINNRKGFGSVVTGGRTPALFLQELAHLVSLLNAVALSTLRNDIEGAESPLDMFVPGSDWPEADGSRNGEIAWQDVFKFMTGADRSPKSRTRYNASRPLSVIGGVSEAEIRFLQTARGAYAKTQICFSWLSEFLVREHLNRELPLHAAIMSRLFQYLDQGMMQYNQARKVSAFYVVVIVFVIPFMLEKYANASFVGCILSFLSVGCLYGLHEVARELENPFRNIPNDLPLCTIQAHFNETLQIIFAGYHPDAYWDKDAAFLSENQVRQEQRNSSTPKASAPRVILQHHFTTIVKHEEQGGDDVLCDTSLSSHGSHTCESSGGSNASELQAFIEEQQQELEQLRNTLATQRALVLERDALCSE